MKRAKTPLLTFLKKGPKSLSAMSAKKEKITKQGHKSKEKRLRGEKKI